MEKWTGPVFLVWFGILGAGPAVAGSPGADTLTVEFPDGALVPFSVTATNLAPGTTGYRGESADGSRLVLFEGRQNSWGTIWARDGTYRYVRAAGGGYWIREAPGSVALEFEEQVSRASDPAPTRRVAPAAEQAGGYTADVLLLYSNSFSSAYGGPSGAREKLQHLNFLANTFLANSGVPLTYRILAMEQYEGGGYTTMDDFRGDEEVVRRREQHGADAVVYFTGDAACSGFATPFNGGQETPDGSAPEFVNPDTDAFAVVNQGVPCREDTYAHELGHVVGAGHDFSSSGNFEWKPYAHGWSCGDAGGGQKYASVMSYGQNRGEAGGDFFSSLQVERQGEVCGSDGATEALQADNVRAMKQAIPYVVNYRSARTGALGSGGGDGEDPSSGALGWPLLAMLLLPGLRRSRSATG